MSSFKFMMNVLRINLLKPTGYFTYHQH